MPRSIAPFQSLPSLACVLDSERGLPPSRSATSDRGGRLPTTTACAPLLGTSPRAPASAGFDRVRVRPGSPQPGFDQLRAEHVSHWATPAPSNGQSCPEVPAWKTYPPSPRATCSAASRSGSRRPASADGTRRTRSGTRSPWTCTRRPTTFSWCRLRSATGRSARRSSTRGRRRRGCGRRSLGEAPTRFDDGAPGGINGALRCYDG